jgi:hypothetical protein
VTSQPSSSQISNRAGDQQRAHSKSAKASAPDNDTIFHVSEALSSIHVTGIGHEGRAFQRVLDHKRIRAVLLVMRVRARLALFVFPGRKVRE